MQPLRAGYFVFIYSVSLLPSTMPVLVIKSDIKHSNSCIFSLINVSSFIFLDIKNSCIFLLHLRLLISSNNRMRIYSSNLSNSDCTILFTHSPFKTNLLLWLLLVLSNCCNVSLVPDKRYLSE